MKGGFLFLLVGGFIAALITVGMTAIIFSDNVRNTESGQYALFVRTGDTYDSIRAQFVDREIIKNAYSLDWVASKMKYKTGIEPGKYIIADNLSNKSIITSLRRGYGEVEVKLALHSIDSREELSSIVSKTLELDSASLASLLHSDSISSSMGLNYDNFWGIVLSDTYNFHWDTNAEGFMKRMQKEYHNFWTEERLAKADYWEMTPMECIILASIIEKESAKTAEYRTIAGVYVNRLQKNWPLQADPTVKYALNEPGLKRILNVHLEVDSPYNTYKNTGLPPGPIGLPEKTTIDAVLEAEQHEFMYFCANADFSGYHVFSKTLAEHNKNARKYQQALNNKGIR